jgi:hypothetical protein
VLDIGLASELQCNLKLTKTKSKLESVLRVGGDFESLVLVALTLKEAGDLVLLVLGNVGQHLASCIKVATKDQGLVLNHTKRKGKGSDGDILVADVDAAISRQVSENVCGLIEV